MKMLATLPNWQPDRLFWRGFHREPTFRDCRSPFGNTCRASSYDAPTKPSGPKTRMLGFKRVLRRPIETAAESGRSKFHPSSHLNDRYWVKRTFRNDNPDRPGWTTAIRSKADIKLHLVLRSATDPKQPFEKHKNTDTKVVCLDMTIIEGQIEPLRKLKESLSGSGITRFNSIGEIRRFLRDFESEKRQLPSHI